MGTATLTLTDFLLARIAEDEYAYAQAAKAVRGWGGDTAKPAITIAADDGSPLWTSERILAECEAKRRIVALHPGDYADGDGRRLYVTDHWCWESGSPYDCDTLRALALPYADHPDFRDEWRP